MCGGATLPVYVYSERQRFMTNVQYKNNLLVIILELVYIIVQLFFSFLINKLEVGRLILFEFAW